MVIDDLDIHGFISHPFEANSPLIIDTNTVLTHPIAFKHLKPVPGRCQKIMQIWGGIQIDQFSTGSALNISRYLCGTITKKDFLCILRCKRLSRRDTIFNTIMIDFPDFSFIGSEGLSKT
jgi:hypothetical protein